MKLDQDKKKIVVIASLILLAIASLGGYLYNAQQNKIRAITDESQATQQALGEDLNQSRQKIDRLDKRIQQLEQEQSALQASLTEEKESRNQSQTELERVRKEKTQLEQEQSALQASLTEEKESRNQSQTELERARKEKTQLEQEQSALQASLTEEKESRNQSQTELERARKEKTQIENSLRAELQSQATTSSELEIELRQQLVQQKALDDKIDTVSSEKDQLLTELESEQERGRQLQLQIAQVTADVGQKEDALNDTEQAVSQLNLQLEQTLQQQKLLKKRIDEINRQRQKDSQQFAELEQRLKQELNESRFAISQLKNRMTVIKLTSEVLFSSGSARIKPTGQKVLSVIAETLNNYPDRAINIEGHTDSVPIGKKSQYTSNWELSTARALAAVDYLQQNNQIDPERLTVVGYGEYHPVSSNETAAGRQLNRRIEIRLLPEALASN